MQCLFVEVIDRDSNSQFTFEILMKFDVCTAVGNAGSVIAANLLMDSSTITGVLISP